MADPLDLDAIEKRALLAEIRLLRGALAADHERLQKAAQSVGIHAGCDAPAEMAEEILVLRRVAAAAKEYRALMLYADAMADKPATVVEMARVGAEALRIEGALDAALKEAGQ